MTSSPPEQQAAALAEAWRAPMLRFARLHLQPAEEAEDAVQESLLALLQAPAATLAQTDARRYLFGILKHKITDRLRAKYRREARDVVCDEPDELDALLFDGRGHWVAEMAPTTWRRLARKPYCVFALRATRLTGPGEMDMARANPAMDSNRLISMDNAR